MIRQISSRLTFFYRFIFPAIVVISITGFALEYLAQAPSMKAPGEFAVMLLISVAFLIISILLQRPLKKVYIDDRNLYVSDFHVETTVPFTNIERITEFYLSEPRRVTIHFKEPTIFGRKIVFKATHRFSPFAAFTSHPIVSELREMISS